MDINPLKRTARSRQALGGFALILFILFPLLASCGTPAPLEFVPIDLGIPSQALKSPIVGQLPGSTVLHVRITFKVSQNLINKLATQPVHPKQKSRLEELANQIGIDDATYQKIKDFFSLKGIALNLSKLRTHLASMRRPAPLLSCFRRILSSISMAAAPFSRPPHLLNCPSS